MRSIFSRSQSDMYIVMRRGALRTIVGTACSVTVLAIAIGIALGHGSAPPPPVHQTPAKPFAASLYTTDEFARLQAANSSLKERVERLAAQLDTLSGFDQRLRAPSQRATANTAVTSARASYGDAAGGPELLPRHCEEGGVHMIPHVTSAEVDCLSTTLTALEQAVAQHEAAWNAFPGRRPLTVGRTSSPFGNRLDPFTRYRSFHPGVDLVAPMGTPILAAAGGRVIRAGQMPGYGNAVEIDHGNGFITLYAHASKIEVRIGQTVQPGQPIAEVGSTGRSTGPHLHFEVRVNDQPVDPEDFLALFARASDKA